MCYRVCYRVTLYGRPATGPSSCASVAPVAWQALLASGGVFDCFQVGLRAFGVLRQGAKEDEQEADFTRCAVCEETVRPASIHPAAAKRREAREPHALAAVFFCLCPWPCVQYEPHEERHCP